MSVKARQVRLGLFATVVALVCVNALAPWGEPAGRMDATVLQAGAGAGAIICGLVFARRAHGLSRSWRLLVVAACLGWLVGELLWRWAGGDSGSGAASQRPSPRTSCPVVRTGGDGRLDSARQLVWAATRTTRSGVPSLTRSSMDLWRLWRSRSWCTSPDWVTCPAACCPGRTTRPSWLRIR